MDAHLQGKSSNITKNFSSHLLNSQFTPIIEEDRYHNYQGERQDSEVTLAALKDFSPK